MLLLNTTDEEDPEEITDPQEIAELFAMMASVAIEALGEDTVRQMLEAVIEQEGRETN